MINYFCSGSWRFKKLCVPCLITCFLWASWYSIYTTNTWESQNHRQHDTLLPVLIYSSLFVFWLLIVCILIVSAGKYTSVKLLDKRIKLTNSRCGILCLCSDIRIFFKIKTKQAKHLGICTSLHGYSLIRINVPITTTTIWGPTYSNHLTENSSGKAAEYSLSSTKETLWKRRVFPAKPCETPKW